MSPDDHSPLVVPGSNAIPCGHSCLHVERCIEKLPLPDKISYIQIDAASDNAGHSVFALLEHLVRRLPVGHTHEEIDRRFGVLSMFIREQSIETPQKF